MLCRKLPMNKGERMTRVIQNNKEADFLKKSQFLCMLLHILMCDKLSIMEITIDRQADDISREIY